MAGADLDALCSHVISVFDCLALGVHDESTLNNVSNFISNSVLRALSRRLGAWNEQNANYRLPPELLNISFGFLSFRDIINVSHVSRSWRAAATAFPNIWAHIDLPPVRGASSLLRMALARAGTLPVDFSFTNDKESDDVESIVVHHLRRFRSIVWQADLANFNDSWNDPAPLLEHLSCTSSFKMNESFLGGQPGRLKKLELGMLYLPHKAPALATVTILSGHAPDDSEESISQLFELFPCLESLALHNLGATDIFPSSPTPRSLTKLYLHSEDFADDAIRLYVDWRTDRLSDVTIHTYDPGTDITPLVLDARHLALDVLATIQTTTPWLVAVDACGHSRTLFLTSCSYNHHQVLMGRILDAAPALELLDSLQISLDDFCRLTEDPRCPRLSALQHLTLRVHESVAPVNRRTGARAGSRSRRFAWKSLDGLANIQIMHLELKAFELEVCYAENGGSPTRDDVLELLKHLVNAVKGGFTSVCIRGFPAAAVRDLHLGSVPGLIIAFETVKV